MAILTEALVRGVVEAVREAGEMLAERGGVHEVHEKNTADFVTNVDLAVQAFLGVRLAELAPEVQFMGEEQDNSDIDIAKPTWILDPVDGTTNLIHGLRRSAVSLAMAEGGRVEFGVVYNPYIPELFTAWRGRGAYLNGEPIRVSRARELSGALLTIGTAPGRREYAPRVFAEMEKLYKSCVDIRRSGCSSLDLCDLAAGRIDGYIERWLMPWDYAAGSLIAEEAGGRVGACDGGELSLTEGGALCASNGALHAALLEALA